MKNLICVNSKSFIGLLYFVLVLLCTACETKETITVPEFKIQQLVFKDILKDTTFTATGNPIIKHQYTADPAALVSKNKLYLYTGHDICPLSGSFYLMKDWLVFSTEDMKTWTEHPVPMRISDFTWVKDDAWAAQVIERNGKFYWYMCAEHKTVSGKAIGVAVSDSPTGPFKDARGTALITNDMTKQINSGWDDIDPSVMIDDDGQAYLYWGNSQCYYVKLKENMTETDGPITAVQNLTGFTEAPWIHKYKDWYYLSYASGFPEKIAYAMSKSVTGPWEYKGILNELASNCNTNHQSIVSFLGNWYFIYHNGLANKNSGDFRRSVCIENLTYKEDGTIVPIVMTTKGVN